MVLVVFGGGGAFGGVWETAEVCGRGEFGEL